MGLFLLSGAASAVNPSAAPSASVNPAFSVTLTGYNAVPGQTDSDPNTTANGGVSNPEVVAARSQDLGDELPFGTIIAISHAPSTSPDCGYDAVSSLIGYRVITDVMNAKIKDHVDVLFKNDAPVKVGNRTLNASRVLGSCTDTMITIVGHMDLKNVNNLPKSQADLAALVTDSGLALK
jgi:3D (Asp-Asp-Asp) domain-containing protein